MNSADYAAQRLDPRWQQKRLRVMERDGFKCVDCGDDKKTLNVHHDYYVTGRMPWNYPMFSLNTLCRDCHKDRHRERDPDEISGEWNEWETEMEWLLCGDGKNQGDFWHTAAIIKQFADKYDPVVAYTTIYGMLLREAGSTFQSPAEPNPHPKDGKEVAF